VDEGIRTAHILAGVLALVAFWTAASMRKGTQRHRIAGRVYLLALFGILASIVPMIVAFASTDITMAVRLGYLMLIVATAIWIAWRAIRDKQHVERFAGPVFRALATAMGLFGTFFLFIGISRGSALVVGFGSIGIVYGIGMWWFVLRGSTGPHWWLAWHFNGICLLFAATHDSFLSLGLRSVLPELQGPVMRSLVLFGILSLAVLLRIWLGRRFIPRLRTRGGELTDVAPKAKAPAFSAGAR
jgi:hypothetical protein